MLLINLLYENVVESLDKLYDFKSSSNDFQVSQTKSNFEGNYTIVLFSLTKKIGKSLLDLGNELGNYLIKNYKSNYTHFNIVQGFLNITLNDQLLINILAKNYSDICFGKLANNGKTVMVEYSSPNTNKPLHLGHLRNNFLGWSVSEIYKANGYNVVKSCIINDRGIHICKSMIAWQRFANGKTPLDVNQKGDHFVGDYYVKFNDAYKLQINELIEKGLSEDEAKKEAEIMKAAQQMLVDWENNDTEVKSLWKKMNGWVYEGMNKTYVDIGSDFDITYYESDTYLLGKKIVQEGLSKKVFYQNDDSSVWIDLTNDGLDEKIVQRKDGTSVYITQDIGLAVQKYEQYKLDESIYVIGDEQNYHMKVLQLICKNLQMPFASGIHHLSYGMVELTTGKMKSREGTVVDADELLKDMLDTAEAHTKELGKINDFDTDELDKLYNTIGLGAMKFFLLKVEPKKRMIFNPTDSIDFHGFTGPFIQYTHARIKSILRKEPIMESLNVTLPLLPLEKQLLLIIERYSSILRNACKEQNPSEIANYIYDLAKTYNSFYAEHKVINAENTEKKILRLYIAAFTANVINSGMAILGINVPERM